MRLEYGDGKDTFCNLKKGGFIKAKKNSNKQEKYWYDQLKILIPSLEEQYTKGKCRLDLVCHLNKVIFEIKLEEWYIDISQYKKYRKKFPDYKIYYLLGYDEICQVNIFENETTEYCEITWREDYSESRIDKIIDHTEEEMKEYINKNKTKKKTKKKATIKKIKTIYLNVEYSQKEDAKKLGARWDPKMRKWYTYPNNENKDKLLSIYS